MTHDVKTVSCLTCNDTGVWETGNNDLPCPHCHRGDVALFNDAFVVGGPITGAEVRRHFLNGSPDPICHTIHIDQLPSRRKR